MIPTYNMNRTGRIQGWYLGEMWNGDPLTAEVATLLAPNADMHRMRRHVQMVGSVDGKSYLEVSFATEY